MKVLRSRTLSDDTYQLVAALSSLVSESGKSTSELSVRVWSASAFRSGYSLKFLARILLRVQEQ